MDFKTYEQTRTSRVVAEASREGGGNGDAEEWVVLNTSPFMHPFHIHVNPFQVKGVTTSGDAQWSPGTPYYNELVTAQGVGGGGVSAAERAFTGEARGVGSALHWRDTIWVPPGGSVRLWMRFDARDPLRENADGGVDPGSVFTGKTVYHCHFLTHEDAGMIENFMLTDGSDAAAALESDLDYDGHVRDGVECGPGGCKAANANLEPHMEITRLENPGSATSVLRGKGKG